MEPDKTPLVAGLLIFAASVLSLKLGLSVAVFEILLGLGAGALDLRAADWMVYLAGFGGILLTFLAGAEVDAKLLAKFTGVYFLARKFFPANLGYFTLLMSTGLTFGLMAALFGLQAGLLDQSQYSVLTGVLIASAVLPTFAAQRWFPPLEEEDII